MRLAGKSGLLLLLACVPALAEVCGEKERQSALYKAISSCQGLRAARGALAMEKVNDLAAIHEGCMVMNYELFPASAAEEEMVQTICRDPAGFLCGQSAKYILSSDCRVAVEAQADLANVPSVVEDHCAYLAKEQIFLDRHRRECGRAAGGRSCLSRLKIRHRKELRKIEWEQAYAPERAGRLRRLFDLVKTREIRMVRESALIPASRKEEIVRLLDKTILDLPPFKGGPPACANTSPKGPEGGIYNDGRGKIEICIGMVEALDAWSDAGLASVLGHELGHSIDPCALEQQALELHRPAPGIALSVYPGLLPCLRGGGGEDGCKQAVLHCTSHPGLHEYCDEFGPPKSRDWAECHAESHKTPSCPDLSAHDAKIESNDLSLYRTKGEASDQIGESFSDYIGVEVLGALLAEKQLGAGGDSGGRLDAVSSAITDLKQLHGGCIQENTKDAHPPAFLRLNRVMMASRRFREALGCLNGPPQTKGAGITCPAL